MRRFIRGCMSMRGMWYRESPSYPRRISFILSRISPSQPTYSNQSQILVPLWIRSLAYDRLVDTSRSSRSANPRRRRSRATGANETPKSCSCNTSTGCTSMPRCPLWSSKSTIKCGMSLASIPPFTSISSRLMRIQLVKLVGNCVHADA